MDNWEDKFEYIMSNDYGQYAVYFSNSDGDYIIKCNRLFRDTVRGSFYYEHLEEEVVKVNEANAKSG